MKNYLSAKEAIDLIKSLAKSQGYYGRLLRDIMSGDFDGFEEWVEERKFSDGLEMIMALEC